MRVSSESDADERMRRADRTTGKKKLLVVAAVAAVALLQYLNSLNCDLVFDDHKAIRENADCDHTQPLVGLFAWFLF